MKKIFCLRDDDTNFFTSIEELENGYGEIWGKYPITLATIPFVHGSEAKIMEYDLSPNKFQLLDECEKQMSAEELTEYHKVHPIGENKKLVYELKEQIKKGMIDIAQHGVHHKYNSFGPELKHFNVALSSIRQGRDYLRKVFDLEVSVLVPPSNTIDNIVAKEVSDLEMNLLCSGPIRFDKSIDKYIHFLCSPKDLFDGIHAKIYKGVPVRKRQELLISDSITFDKSKEDEEIYKQIIDKLNRFGCYSMTTHYRLLSDKQYRERYIRMVNRIASDDTIEFVTATEYFKRIMEYIK